MFMSSPGCWQVVVPEWRVTQFKPTQAHGNADGLSRLPLTAQVCLMLLKLPVDLPANPLCVS